MENTITKNAKIGLYAYYLAEQINLKNLKADFTAKLLNQTASELYYELNPNSYFIVFNYGVVVFANVDKLEMSKSIHFLRGFCTHFMDEKIDEEYQIEVSNRKEMHFSFNELIVPRLDEHIIKITMLNLAQSVALDYYMNIAENLLTEVKQFTEHMEHKGTLNLSKKQMLKFIGKSLNTKNKIAENLYIFDTPDATWDDEVLDKLNRGLNSTFELKPRYKEIEATFRNIEDNLYVFMELNQHQESNKLEWIIIILIMIEVADLFLTKIF